ncbi:LysE family translocator [Pedobacter flavus]|uniref:LysE family translocator n=1 Tax=Pedobacter flavus TaxID=3113906 RepID=A0ABU7H3N6_9SPHI|nr:LysE family translocator [Pedobacter sp. VNH31]MEE1885196.1 LysE family translocator [Pedobacter sp. VNH31]
MIEAILQGILAGIIFSFLTGPVFFSMIKTSIEKGFKAGLSLAIGVILSDLIFVVLTLYGTSIVSINAQYYEVIGLCGGAFLLGIGLFYLIRKAKVNYNIADEIKVKKRGYILKGFFMCILSPTTYMFWIIVGGIVSAQLHYNLDQKIAFFLTAMSTQFSVDVAKTYYSAKLRHRINEKTLIILNRIAGVIIIIFSLRIFLELILKHWYF